jgi:hypothetical protein
VFSRADVKQVLSQYSLVQLYTDIVPAVYQPTTSAAENSRFQSQTFHDDRLPLYVILKPLAGGKFEEVRRYDEGKINDVDAFIRFLKEPLAANKGEAVAVVPSR